MLYKQVYWHSLLVSFVVRLLVCYILYVFHCTWCVRSSWLLINGYEWMNECEQYTHTQWGAQFKGVCVNVNRGCTTPSGGVNNSLLWTKMRRKLYSSWLSVNVCQCCCMVWRFTLLICLNYQFYHKQIFMQLFQTNSIETVQACQENFHFELPGVLFCLRKERKN